MCKYVYICGYMWKYVEICGKGIEHKPPKRAPQPYLLGLNGLTIINALGYFKKQRITEKTVL